MDAQMKKGLIDALVLSILTEGDSYGYKLTQEISALMEISESTLYPALRRLERQGLLTTYSMEHNSRLRKYYKIAACGEARLSEFKISWENVKKVIDYILTEGDKHEQK